MSDQLAYHDDLIEQGYTEEEALEHTLRYFPEFSLDGRKPDPAPPPGHEAIPSNSVSTSGKNTDSFNFDRMIFKAGVYYDNTKVSIKENKKIVFSILGLVAVIFVVYLVFQIPASTHPIEGSWTKADGQIFTFDIDGTFEDGTGNDATWEIEDDVVTLTSEIDNGNDDTSTIVQTLKQGFSDDEKAMWMSWVSLEIDGDDSSTSEVEGTCILLVKDSNSYSEDSAKYETERPSWCAE